MDEKSGDMREHIMNLALKLVGCPYRWGGANPWVGFDCSGFVLWVYQVFGLLPSGDWTAQKLYDLLREGVLSTGAEPQPGDLVFYGDAPNKITHVMMYVGGGLAVGASGGDRTTLTLEEARRRGAMVKVKPLSYRNDMHRVVRAPVKF